MSNNITIQINDQSVVIIFFIDGRIGRERLIYDAVTLRDEIEALVDDKMYVKATVILNTKDQIYKAVEVDSTMPLYDSMRLAKAELEVLCANCELRKVIVCGNDSMSLAAARFNKLAQECFDIATDSKVVLTEYRLLPLEAGKILKLLSARKLLEYDKQKRHLVVIEQSTGVTCVLLQNDIVRSYKIIAPSANTPLCGSNVSELISETIELYKQQDKALISVVIALRGTPIHNASNVFYSEDLLHAIEVKCAESNSCKSEILLAVLSKHYKEYSHPLYSDKSKKYLTILRYIPVLQAINFSSAFLICSLFIYVSAFKIPELRSTYDILHSTYQSLANDHQALQADINAMQERSNIVSNVVWIYHMIGADVAKHPFVKLRTLTELDRPEYISVQYFNWSKERFGRNISDSFDIGIKVNRAKVENAVLFGGYNDFIASIKSSFPEYNFITSSINYIEQPQINSAFEVVLSAYDKSVRMEQ